MKIKPTQLFLRGNSPFYYVRFQVAGARRTRCTHRATLEEARPVAAEMIRLARAGRFALVDERMLARRAVASVGEVLRVYRRVCAPPVLAERTVADNCNALRLVVREGLERPGMSAEEVEGLATSVLSRGLARGFERGRESRATAETIEQVRGTVAGYLRQARSVFGARLAAEYGECGLVLPDLKGFLEFVPREQHRQPAVPPSDEEVAPLFAAALRLREEDPAAFVAWSLALFTGLRRGELSRLRWEWWRRENGAEVFVLPGYGVKNRRTARVELPRQLVEVLGWWRERCPDAEYMIPCPAVGRGGPGARVRGEAVFARVYSWMRGLGWERRFKLHGMRAWYGSYVERHYGLRAAQGLMRHSTPAVTQGRYTGLPQVAGVTVEVDLGAAERGKRRDGETEKPPGEPGAGTDGEGI